MPTRLHAISRCIFRCSMAFLGFVRPPFSYIIIFYGVANQSRSTGPSVLADADDTAKAILTLYLLGRTTSLDAMIEHFRSKQGHFQTYLGERNVSLSANCNILKAILADPGFPKYESDIWAITSYLCDSWWNGAVKDKWVSLPAFIPFRGLKLKQLHRTHPTSIV